MLWLLLMSGAFGAYMLAKGHAAAEGGLPAATTGGFTGDSGMTYLVVRGQSGPDGRRLLAVRDSDDGDIILNYVENPDGSLTFLSSAPPTANVPQSLIAQARKDFSKFEA